MKSTISKIKSSSNSEREFELAEERRKNELDRLEKERAEMEAQVIYRKDWTGGMWVSLFTSRCLNRGIKSRYRKMEKNIC